MCCWSIPKVSAYFQKWQYFWRRCFQFELYSYPAALFDRSFVFRKLLKAVMAAFVLDQWAVCLCWMVALCFTIYHGRTVNETYATILDKYSDNVQFRYPRTTVVFDDYENIPSTKGMVKRCEEKWDSYINMGLKVSLTQTRVKTICIWWKGVLWCSVSATLQIPISHPQSDYRLDEHWVSE